METLLFVVLGMLVLGSGLALSGLVLTGVIATARTLLKTVTNARGKALPAG
ncbi:hypothetical protein N825_09135 [Skermanella stibiiresistens SB22]|uniref:Uncharacterized protein n=1 Tax=Skermanella stibiiresistens SB22 TaxID=1385369 RepID=W9GVC1_9PROT|nr:hypothetical protein [Skermanella stibiiresistens]EWY37734.1 hypothetical protein N825_09135 [Skermanella stibiiresistens SB22]